MLAEAEPWHREHLGHLYSLWDEWNAAYFDGAMVPPIITSPSFNRWVEYMEREGSAIFKSLADKRDPENRYTNWLEWRDIHGHAHGGTVWGDSPRLVGEYGAELLRLPSGAQVTPHGASMSKLEGDRGRARGGAPSQVIFNGTVNLQPASTNVHDAIRAAALTRARYS